MPLLLAISSILTSLSSYLPRRLIAPFIDTSFNALRHEELNLSLLQMPYSEIISQCIYLCNIKKRNAAVLCFGTDHYAQVGCILIEAAP
jgi:hypothetical protein